MAWQKDYGKAAKVAADRAEAQADRAEQSADEAQAVANANKTKWLPAVATVALRNSTYPNPAHGDSVKVTGESRIYRFDSVSGWVVTDEYNATAIDGVTAQLAEKATKTEVDTKVAQIVSGSPKGVYATFATLQSAFPTGSTGTYLVLGSNGVNEVDTLTVTAIPTAPGNVTVTLNGVAKTIAVDPASDTTTILVAAKIRAATYTGWTTGGTGSTVTFTKTTVGTNTSPIFSAGSTGVVATFTITTTGVAVRSSDWYYWNGTAWTAGGVYQSTGINKETEGGNLYVYSSQFTADRYINTAGNVGFVAGWGYAKLPVTANNVYSIWMSNGNYSLDIGSVAFYQDDVLLSYVLGTDYINGAYNGVNFITLTTPANCNNIRITNKRGAAPTFDNSTSLLFVKGSVVNDDALTKKIISIDGTIIKTPNIKKTYEGVKWAAVGDSLTEHNFRALKNYHDYIKDETGITVANLGVSGTGYKKKEEINSAFYQRVSFIPVDSDVVTIFGSGNDLSLPLGSPTDTTTTTICGCVNITLDNYYSLLPTVPIGIITPSPWVGYPNYTTGNAMELYSDALIAICKRRSIPYLDLYRCSNLRPWDSEFRTLMYSRDEGNGVHPDENGHKIISTKIREFLKTLI